MASETLPSSSEERTDTANISQLKALSLNFLQNISEISNEEEVPKLSPCHKCRKEILTFPLRAFVVLSCEHIFHRTCIEQHIIRTDTQVPTYPSCPICSTVIEVIREEGTLASDKYQMVPKIRSLIDSEKKASQHSNDTVDGIVDDDGGDLEEMIRLGLIVDESVQDTSHIGKEKGTINVVQVNSTDQDNINKSTDTQERGTSPIVVDDDEQDLSKETDERDIVQSLLGELSTPINGETVEAMIDEDENNKNSAPKSLSILFQKACRAEMRVMKANQEEITCWYYYGKGFEGRVEDILKNERGVRDQFARNRVYNEIVQHIPGYLKDNLRKRTQRAIKIYKLFRNIGVNKIKRINSYGANAISKLTVTQIQLIEQHFSKAQTEESGHV